MLSFWLIAGAWDKAYEWTTLSASDRSTIKAQYAAAGIKLLVAAFGATDVPTTTNADPVTTANNLASFVTTYGLDGVDIDYEDSPSFESASGGGEQFLISLTQALRQQLPAGQFLISHAPQAPYFRTDGFYPNGAYLAIHRAVGSK